MKFSESIQGAAAILIICVMVLAVAGPITFGVVAGNKGYQDHRLKKNTCNMLLKNEDYNNYMRVCKSVDLIQVEVNGDEVPNGVWLVDKENSKNAK